LAGDFRQWARWPWITCSDVPIVGGAGPGSERRYVVCFGGTRFWRRHDDLAREGHTENKVYVLGRYERGMLMAAKTTVFGHGLGGRAILAILVVILFIFTALSTKRSGSIVRDFHI